MMRLKNREERVRQGTTLECASCFDRFLFEDMVPCKNKGHLFCKACMASYDETQLFSCGTFGVNTLTKEPNLELTCFHGEGCKSGFERSHLKRALKPKVLRKHDQMQTRTAVELAGMSDELYSCPK